MGRLIDADELIDWIQNCWDWATVDGITSTTVLKQTMTDISQLPTVEAIPKDRITKAIDEVEKYICDVETDTVKAQGMAQALDIFEQTLRGLEDGNNNQHN